jgi:mono/diheme cytochrome c family protein
MRHQIVNRVVLAFVVLCLACAWLFARVAQRNVAPEDASGPAVVGGAQLFDARCGSCHDAAALSADLAAAPDRAARRRELDTLLQDHGDATAAEDRLILDFLERRR